jgi:hypothetical protein
LSFGKAYKLAVVLTKSQLRGNQRRKLIARLFGDPRIILLTDAALLAVPALLGYFLLSSGLLPTELSSPVQQIEAQALSGIPSILAFSIILFGVLSEISQPTQSMSTDLINWLPISPGEYVAGSTMSLSYTYSFILAFLLGASLGPAVLYNMVPVWIVATAMSGLSLVIGASVVELLRGLTNRISSSFYKKSGRSGIFLRLTLTVIVLVFFQLLFSGRIILYFVEGAMQTIRAAWFVPVVWPSLAVLSESQGDVLGSSLFGALTVGFFLALFVLAVRVRTLYWVPVPVSIRLTNQTYRPLGASRLIPGFDAAESAIFRKDLRSLFRRREMARLLAIPFVLAISLGISLFPIGGTSIPESADFSVLIPVYVMPVAIFCAILSMTSIGQEGNAVWNLYVAPLTPKQLVKVKLAIPVILGLTFSVALLVLLGFILKTTLASFILLMGLSVAVVFFESALGLYFAARFADFRDMIRSRFVSVWGSMFGTFISLVLVGLTVAPLMISIALQGSITAVYVALTFAIGFIIFVVSWRLAQKQMTKLLQEIQV